MLIGIALFYELYAYVNNIYLPLAILTVFAYLGLERLSFSRKSEEKSTICHMCKLYSICDLKQKGKAEFCNIFEPNVTEKAKNSPA